MKIKNILLSFLCGMTLLTGFSACSDDDNASLSWKEGATVSVPNYRAFILTEGSMGKNNSHLTFVNLDKDTVFRGDIYEAQNGKENLGDTGNDMITYNGDLYVVMNGSEVLYRLNGSGVRQAVYSDFEKDKLGQPRSIVEANGKIFVTCYGGYIARFDAKTLAFEDSVKVGPNPEEIINYNGLLMCVNSGWGSGHTLSMVNSGLFDKVVNVEIPTNSFGLKQVGKYVYTLSYGASYPTYVSELDLETMTYKKVADASRILPVESDLYMAHSVSDKETHEVTTTFSVYHSKTKAIEPWVLKGAPEALAKSTVYMLERNPYDGSYFIATTDYVSNGTIYHFAANGTYLSQFSAGGINANSMVFLMN